MGEELKRCPFCGGKASICKDYDPDGDGTFYSYKCTDCGSKSMERYAVETCPIFYGTLRDDWNARADNDTIEALRKELSECKAERDDFKRKLFPYAEDTEISGLSWGGMYLIGDQKSVKELKNIKHRADQLEQFIEHNKAQLTTIRNETIDECAAVVECDGSSHDAPLPHTSQWVNETSLQTRATDRVAEAIRKLKVADK